MCGYCWPLQQRFATRNNVDLSFLGSLHDHGDRLIRAMSQFEHALLTVRAGSVDAFEILWDRHPNLVVLALETGGELPAREPDCLYRMRVGRDLPSMIACTRESLRIIAQPAST